MQLMKYLLAALQLLILSAKAEDTPTWTEPKKAAAEDPDFTIQGEYTHGDKALQVVALGKGKFHISSYNGGLPGAGWDGGEIKASTATTGEITKQLTDFKRIERKSPTLGKEPPADAIVLFDGKNADAWEKGKVTDGLLESGTQTKDSFGSFQLHVEFRTPFKPETPPGSQKRGNSGIYIHHRYETQVLDTFGLNLDRKDWEKRGEKLPSDPKQWCGCLYKFKLADLNMCFPPLAWQTYDITFTAATFEDGKKTKNARITVIHNGVKIHDDVELPQGTGAGAKKEEIAEGPIVLQGHGNPIRYRNVWLIKK